MQGYKFDIYELINDKREFVTSWYCIESTREKAFDRTLEIMQKLYPNKKLKIVEVKYIGD